MPGGAVEVYFPAAVLILGADDLFVTVEDDFVFDAVFQIDFDLQPLQFPIGVDGLVLRTAAALLLDFDLSPASHFKMMMNIK